jgi:ferredoxin-thioredoxin reductase catalytic subunit
MSSLMRVAKQTRGGAVSKNCRNCHSKKGETQWIVCECKDRNGDYQEATELDLSKLPLQRPGLQLALQD